MQAGKLAWSIDRMPDCNIESQSDIAGRLAGFEAMDSFSGCFDHNTAWLHCRQLGNRDLKDTQAASMYQSVIAKIGSQTANSRLDLRCS